MSNTSASLSLNGSPARMGVDGIELGQRWSQVMPQAQTLYGVEPVCEARKIARGNSRRAWLLETCSYQPSDAMLNERPVRLVRHYFINQELLRIDLGMAGSDAELDAVASELDSIYGSGRSQTEDGQTAVIWQQAQDEAALRLANEVLPTGQSATDAASGVAPMLDKAIAGEAGKPSANGAEVGSDGNTSAAPVPLIMLYLRDIKAADEALAIAGW